MLLLAKRAVYFRVWTLSSLPVNIYQTEGMNTNLVWKECPPMTKAIKLLSFILLLSACFSAEAQVDAASCNTTDVQTAINAATEGQTVNVPSGTCTWTSGVTISGKGITVVGAGSGRIIVQSATTLTIGTGTQTFTVISTRVDGTFPLGPTVGQTLRAFQAGARGNWMQGTVTSFNPGTGSLVMDITSTNGSGSVPIWLIGTIPSTTIANNSTGAPLFNITEDTAFHTNISGIKFLQGTTTQFNADDVVIQYASGGQAVLIHDCWMEAGGGGSQIYAHSNRGVVWNCSFDSSPFSQGGSVNSAISVVLGGTQAATSWTTPSTWGAADTNFQGNFYFETNDVHDYLISGGTDDGGRMVWRYNFMDEAGWGDHGADSSTYGARTLEYYNNTGIFDTRSGVVFNLTDGWVFNRGGTMVMFNNNLPNISSSDSGQKANVILADYTLGTNGGANPCWGSGTHTPGQYYLSPRQFGLGYVTGTGTTNYPADNCNNCTKDQNGIYVGDSEPAYIWSNSGTIGAPVTNLYLSDQSSSCTNQDQSANYIVSGRDFFNTASTAKPGYTPATYPNPLTQDQAPPPNPPTGLQATVN